MKVPVYVMLVEKCVTVQHSSKERITIILPKGNQSFIGSIYCHNTEKKSQLLLVKYHLLLSTTNIPVVVHLHYEENKLSLVCHLLDASCTR